MEITVHVSVDRELAFIHAGTCGQETTAGSLNGGSKITGSGCEYWDYNDPNMWNNDHWDNDWRNDNDNWSHWDSATGVRVSVLTCLLAGAAAAAL